VPCLGNVIAGNGGDGIHAESFVDGKATNNYIGLDAAGAAAMGNAGDGVDLTDGFANIGEGRGRNVISANGGHGIRLTGTQTVYYNSIVSANYIGTDATGTVALGNKGSGVYIEHEEVVVGDTLNIDTTHTTEYYICVQGRG